MMPPPCGRSRSSTPWASATPIQTTPKTVIAIPSVPAFCWASVTTNSTGKNASSASRTWKPSPKYAARISAMTPMKPARRTGSASA